MNLQGLPDNVQRRIALLLQAPAKLAAEGTSVLSSAGAASPDHNASGAAEAHDDRSAHPLHICSLHHQARLLARKLHATQCSAVDTSFLGQQPLQVPHRSSS